ncbi:DUF4355 domain-containing protein [Lactobacillus sp. CC-MHH1034]|uniref:DUF4355 domain-containing protein n=1 Tax=Agrilactobacillus fermenti TaxID=2586909 RepID=UPI001E3E5AD8|nr:DUF4355 domain-containing protein [Agrilactobacillus fermenti]MCD2255769.1 DUF4355 domain-containing protein [Agrilactobacillus fermenti]
MNYKQYVLSVLGNRSFAPDTGSDGADPSVGDTSQESSDLEPESKLDETKSAKPEPDKDDTQKKDKTYSESELNQIIHERLERDRRQREKELNEAEKLKKMSDSDRSKYQVEKLQKELADQKAINDRNEMSKVARSLFTDEGILVDENDLSLVVTTEASSTKANTNTLIDLINRVKAEEKKKYLSGQTPKVSHQSLKDPGIQAAEVRNQANTITQDPWHKNN